MISSEYISLPEKYHFTNEVAINQNGNEKTVYHARDLSGVEYAVKVLSDTWSKDPVVLSQRIANEFDATKIIRETSLAKFIPEPIELVSVNGYAIGMIMSWRDGDIINKLGPCLSVEEVEELKEGLLSLPNATRLSFDTFSSLNICHNQTNGLWLAEIEIDESKKSEKEYKEQVKGAMKKIQKYYTLSNQNNRIW